MVGIGWLGQANGDFKQSNGEQHVTRVDDKLDRSMYPRNRFCDSKRLIITHYSRIEIY